METFGFESDCLVIIASFGFENIVRAGFWLWSNSSA